MVLRAWYMDSTDADQRAPHQLEPNQPVAPEYLHKRLGVISWALDMSGPPEANAQLSAIRKERNYSYMDVITISPEKLENYEGKLKIFFKEHLHTDEEIRLILEGTGYFDVRDVDDRWIRISMEAGDMIVLPAGMYHRFTLDEANYLKAMRLFVGDPVWTPHNREAEGVDEMAERLAYSAAVAASAS